MTRTCSEQSPLDCQFSAQPLFRRIAPMTWTAGGRSLRRGAQLRSNMIDEMPIGGLDEKMFRVTIASQCGVLRYD